MTLLTWLLWTDFCFSSNDAVSLSVSFESSFVSTEFSSTLPLDDIRESDVALSSEWHKKNPRLYLNVPDKCKKY